MSRVECKDYHYPDNNRYHHNWAAHHAHRNYPNHSHDCLAQYMPKAPEPPMIELYVEC